jgi:DNA-binding transcriptional LysR family regulator
MNIRQLETFYWIARLGTFSSAAERLHTSQANVSARIRELESELDVTLFDRIGRHVQLTLKGRELLVHAERVVADAAKLRLAAGKPDMVQGVVKIGVGEVIAARSLVAMINELKRYFPGLDVEFDVDVNANLKHKLERGSIDVAVIGGPVEEPELKVAPIGAVRVAWVGTPALLGDATTVGPGDLAPLPILSLGREARLFTQMQAWFAEAAAVPVTVSYCNNLSTMLEVARAGVCICMVPEELVTAEIAAGTLRAPVPVPPLPPLTFFVATRAESIDPAIAEIARIVAEVTRLPPLGELATAPARSAQPGAGACVASRQPEREPTAAARRVHRSSTAATAKRRPRLQ